MLFYFPRHPPSQAWTMAANMTEVLQWAQEHGITPAALAELSSWGAEHGMGFADLQHQILTIDSTVENLTASKYLSG